MAAYISDLQRHLRVAEKLLNGADDMRSVPLRVYINRKMAMLRLIPPLREDGQMCTLGDALELIAPGHVTEAQRVVVQVRQSVGRASNAEHSPIYRCPASQGVAPPVDAPLLELHRSLHHPDFFLYVVVH